jgi:HEAT repeat protein/S1-C subfamily serine protease
MPILFPCPKCRKMISAAPEWAGRYVACPSCGAHAQVTAPEVLSLDDDEPPRPAPLPAPSRQPAPAAPARPRRKATVPQDDDEPRGGGGSGLALIIGVLGLLALGGGVLWFILKDKVNKPDPAAVQAAEAGEKDKAKSKDDDRPVRTALTGDQIFKRLLKSTAFIVSKDPAGEAFGSGALVHLDKKLVLTNYHVVRKEPVATVYFPAYDKDGREISNAEHYKNNKDKLAVSGRVVKRDEQRDLALIELADVPADVRPLPLARKSSVPGQTVHSIGASGVGDGVLWRYTTGTVRQVADKDITFPDQHFKATVLETQAPINPGDSGGPVVNDRVELVAVVCMTRKDKALVSSSVDVREARAFLEQYFAANGSKWEDLPTAEPVEEEPVNERLLKDLGNADPAVKIAAARKLGAMGAEAKFAIPDLVRELKGVNAEVRQAAAEALDRIGPPLPAQRAVLLEAIQEVAPAPRRYAYRMAAEPGLASREMLPWLLAALNDSDPSVRLPAAVALGNLGPDAKADTFVPLIARLKDKDAGVARAANEAVRKLGPFAKHDMAVLTIAFKDERPEPRLFAAEALAAIRMEPDEALRLWQPALKDAESAIRSTAAAELAKLGLAASPARDDLLKAVKDPVPAVRLAAVRAVVALGAGKDSAPALLGLLADPDPEMRKIVAEELAKVKPEGKDDLPLLRGFLKSGQPKLRDAALVGLAKIGPDAREVVPELVALANKEDAATRREVVRVLAAFGPGAKDAVPDLIAWAKGREAGLRTEAIRALMAVGPEAKPAVPLLGELLTGDNPILAMEAASALAKLGPDGIRALSKGLDRKAGALRLSVADTLVKAGPDAEPAIPELIAVLGTDPDSDLRGKVIDALAGVGAKGVPTLTKRCQDDNNPAVRVGIINALGQIGPEAKDALKMLESLATYEKKSITVRDAAADAVRKIKK